MGAIWRSRPRPNSKTMHIHYSIQRFFIFFFRGRECDTREAEWIQYNPLVRAIAAIFFRPSFEHFVCVMDFWAANVMGRFLVVLMLVCAAGDSVLGGRDYDYRQCESTVKIWADKSLRELEGRTEQESLKLKELLFFLHVPRTGGRTFFHCLLRHLIPKGQECPRSYDKLRFDPSKPGCRLVGTHDDYSLMTMLPSERTSVVTVLRNPVDRVFSSYEFSTEVGARFLIHPNLSSAMRLRRQGSRNNTGVSTLDIWPWRYLVPWMREDLFVRRDARSQGRIMIQKDQDVDPYNFPAMLMPLHEYIHQPLAYDIVHNGATFQVAGITNNSHLEEAQRIRQCVRKYSSLGRHVLEVAKRRLGQMLYVGLQENHRESAKMFTNMVGAQVTAQLQHSNDYMNLSSKADSNRTDFIPLSLDAKVEETTQATSLDPKVDETTQGKSSMKVPETSIVPPSKNSKEQDETLTVAKLVETYEKCAITSRSTQIKRRYTSLNGIAPANFTKEARARVPQNIIKEIENLNSLDVELYKYAQNLYSRQQKVLAKQGEQQTSLRHESSSQENKFYSRVSRWPPLSNFWPVLMLFAVILIVAKTVGTRNRVLKEKV